MQHNCHYDAAETLWFGPADHPGRGGLPLAPGNPGNPILSVDQTSEAITIKLRDGMYRDVTLILPVRPLREPARCVVCGAGPFAMPGNLVGQDADAFDNHVDAE
jgi:hypothetical protein